MQTRTSTFPDQEKLLERVNLRYLKTLKIKKVNIKNPQIKHCPCPKYVMIYRPVYRPDIQFADQKKTAKKVTKN